MTRKNDGSSWTVIKRHPVKLFRPGYKFIKRGFDIIICSCASIFLLPISVMVAIAIKIDSKGPVLFTQERVGLGGKSFKIYKFRTLEHNLDDSAHREFMKKFVHGNIEKQDGHTVFKPFQKNQVTRVGAILRKTSLDEIPQIYNVFKGDMSLVGPRPNVLWEVDAYREWHKERLEVLPGITGLAQIRGRSGILFDQIVEHDIEYIRHQSIWFDIKILWYTFYSIIMRKGAK